jgi:hypothetical protein
VGTIDGGVKEHLKMEDEPTAPIPPAAPPEGVEPTPPPSIEAPPPAPAQPPPSWPPQPPPSWPPSGAGKPNRASRVLGHRATGWFVAALLVGAVVGLSVALADAPTVARANVTLPSRAALRPPGGFQVPAPATGPRTFRFGNVTAGEVTAVSASSFTVSTVSGPVVTVDEQSSTIYRSAGSSVTKASVKKGDDVLVVGSKSGSTVKANEVIIGSKGLPFFFPAAGSSGG